MNDQQFIVTGTDELPDVDSTPQGSIFINTKNTMFRLVEDEWVKLGIS